MKAPKRNGRAKRLRPGDPAKWGKLDDRLEAKLIAHIKEGLSYQTCCDLVGLSRATFYNWIARGESEPQGPYGAFVKAVAAANAKACRELHIAVKRVDPKWLLERRFPAEYPSPKLRTETELRSGTKTRGEHQITIGLDKADLEALGRWSGLPFSEDGMIQFPMCDGNGEPLTEKDRELRERLNASRMVRGNRNGSREEVST
jgi:hypothetical protein